jgi:RNA polymerase sigma factor (sigma-70 family)
MVWAVCRRMLPNPADAEDAFQAVFLALVRSAGKLRAATALGGWLHGVAVRACLQLRRGAVRRKQRERASAKPETATVDPKWADLHAAVHEEVEQLPAPLRTAFVLCELQGVRQPDAAAQLGWKLGTLSGRLTRARQHLLKNLTARGLTPLAVAGAVGGAGLPAALADQATAVMKHGPDAASGVSTTVLELARGATEGMMAKVKWTVGSLMLTTGLMVTVGTGWLPTAGAQRPVTEPKPATAPTGADVGTTNADPTAAPAAAAPKKAGTTAAGRQRFEHLAVMPPRNAEELAKLFQEKEKEGWEYVSTAPTMSAGEVTHHLVFKRPKGTPVTAGTVPALPNVYNTTSAPAANYPSVYAPRGADNTDPAVYPNTPVVRYPLTAAPSLNAPKTTTPPAGEPKKSASADATVIRLKHLSTEQASKLILPILGTSHKQLGGSADTVAVPESGVIVLYGVSKEQVAKIRELLDEVDVPTKKKSDAEAVFRSTT